jgi:hypothetical protein
MYSQQKIDLSLILFCGRMRSETMRASDLLSALVISPTESVYEGLFIEHEKELKLVTNIEKNGETIVFIFDEGTPESMNIIYKLLMLNKRCQLSKRVDHEEIPIYGFKEVGKKIIL